ncbi:MULTISPECIES: energy-coupling factor transporter transmembrane protein EcfT [unclassified Methanoregula]|uniref:energy-coupling factor transporter transmembrane component T family protein n=1 Tax=unclassified Methanoregula TaxID=2649730 RepID=UPI0009C77818|nr:MULTISPECIES: energy-coupling factor transporter transmembrane component T [unclassified Methanoregula]OPX62813.1 MAG: Energy-coupling factor transporter transmembrane protein EcfT [Methanoregula sp. PtaB.Bin085]OPY35250.1 MAG: Energy-coupling factor transporter transmembrane protein EcfT [Methanoregula sp. PtaU1.Bin006]
MIEELFEIERDAQKDSVVHRLDARVKIAIAFAAIIALVAVPYSTMVYTIGAVFFCFFAFLWCCTRLSPVTYLKRLISIVPLWGVIIFFQIFLKNKYYTDYHTVLSLPLGISIYAESIEFAFILLVKFMVCISFIILLSSTTRMHDMLEGAARMGLPAEFALALGMMIRYLFVFGYMFRKINETLKTKCFDAFDRHLPYRYRLRQLGYMIGTMFIRSYEQGERVYTSMLCRGYGKDSYLFVQRKPLKGTEWAVLCFSLAFITVIPLAVWLTSFRLL